MSDFNELSPDPYTAFTPPGDAGWRDWFLRLQAFLQGVCKTKQDVEALGITVDGGGP